MRQLASSRSKFASIGGESPNVSRLVYFTARRGSGAYQTVTTRAPASTPLPENDGRHDCSMTTFTASKVPAGTVMRSSPATRPLASQTTAPVHAGSAISMARAAASCLSRIIR
jgi:hypothetical protein